MYSSSTVIKPLLGDVRPGGNDDLFAKLIFWGSLLIVDGYMMGTSVSLVRAVVRIMRLPF